MANPKMTLRFSILRILTAMGEITQAEADKLNATDDADMDLVKLTFDSLALLDFCLQVETTIGPVIDPDEIAELHSLSELEAELARRMAA